MGETDFHTGVSPKWVKSKRRKRREKKDRKLVITMAKLRMAHASRLGQKKERPKVGDNNGTKRNLKNMVH